MTRELGWEKYADPQNPRMFTFPGTPLARLAKDMETKLKIRTMRVVGDPKLPVRRVIASWGNVSQMPGIPFLARPDVDVLVVGETHEWELVEYAQDTIASGKKKALIVLGHVVSEQAGMKYCAEWLKGFIKEVPIEFIAAAEPFWRPDKPQG
jgi:putative NIF3 family GTP cyclohydrolase 1 type 2